MFERLTNRTKHGIAYTKIPANESNMVDVGECYTGRIVDRIAAYEDIGLSPERIKQILDSRPLHRIEKGQIIVDKDAFNHCNELATAYSKIGTVNEFAELAKAKAEGRLAILPLKVGSTIYRPEAPQYSWEIVSATIYLDETIFTDDSDNIIKETDIGKTVFLTREEAEKAIGLGHAPAEVIRREE